jgi:hypothetical protein
VRRNMGLLQHIVAQQMHLSWVDDGKGGREIKPGWYLAIEFNYKSPPRNSRAEIKEVTDNWLAELASMFDAVPAQSRYLSGPLGVFALTDDYPWLETYTEILMFAQKPILQAHVAAARAHNFYLMRRTSGKLGAKSTMKYHFFHPATLEDALGPKRQLRRNLELTRIDADSGIICQEFIPRNHIRICLHENIGGQLVSTGDRHSTRYPLEYFKGVPFDVGGKRMFIIDPRYTLLKERGVITAGLTRHPEKHQELIRRLKIWLAQHPPPAGLPAAENHSRSV